MVVACLVVTGCSKSDDSTDAVAPAGGQQSTQFKGAAPQPGVVGGPASQPTTAQ